MMNKWLIDVGDVPEEVTAYTLEEVEALVRNHIAIREDDEEQNCLECGKLKPLCACVISKDGK